MPLTSQSNSAVHDAIVVTILRISDLGVRGHRKSRGLKILITPIVHFQQLGQQIDQPEDSRLELEFLIICLGTTLRLWLARHPLCTVVV